jgi:hypothetical protein
MNFFALIFSAGYFDFLVKYDLKHPDCVLQLKVFTHVERKTRIQDKLIILQ